MNLFYPAYPANLVLFFFSHEEACLKRVIFLAGIADCISVFNSLSFSAFLRLCV